MLGERLSSGIEPTAGSAMILASRSLQTVGWKQAAECRSTLLVVMKRKSQPRREA